jgi:hypothetical protein
MKAAYISLILLFLYSAIYMVESTGVLGAYTITTPLNTYNEINSSFRQVYYNGSEVIGVTEDAYGTKQPWEYFVYYWDKVKSFFGLCLNFGGWLNTNFGAPFYIYAPINAIIYIIYLLTLIELFAGKKGL